MPNCDDLQMTSQLNLKTKLAKLFENVKDEHMRNGTSLFYWNPVVSTWKISCSANGFTRK